MPTLTVKIADFINKAQTKGRALGADLNAQYDELKFLSDDAKFNLAKIYEARHFIRILMSSGYGGLTEKQIRDLIDFFWLWLELNEVSYVAYTNAPLPPGYVINS